MVRDILTLVTWISTYLETVKSGGLGWNHLRCEPDNDKSWNADNVSNNQKYFWAVYHPLQQ